MQYTQHFKYVHLIPCGHFQITRLRTISRGHVAGSLYASSIICGYHCSVVQEELFRILSCVLGCKGNARSIRVSMISSKRHLLAFLIIFPLENSVERVSPLNTSKLASKIVHLVFHQLQII